MYRKITQFLQNWKENPFRRPLILQGARQVGKTYALLEFGKAHYENVAYFNFETNPSLAQPFHLRPDLPSGQTFPASGEKNLTGGGFLLPGILF